MRTILVEMGSGVLNEIERKDDRNSGCLTVGK